MNTPGASRRHESLSPSARALLGLLRLDGGPAAAARVRDWPARTWDEIVELALLHGVAPLLHRALQSGGAFAECPERIRVRLEEERRATALVNLRNLGQFRRVARGLRERGIPVIPLKGLHLAELVYRDISLRPMSDMDILVPRSQLMSAVAALRELNYGFDEDMSSAADAMLDTKCNVGLAHRELDVWLEVHWSLSEPPGRYTAVVECIWRGAVPGRLGDAETLLMSPEFLLLHVCAHLACNHVFLFSLRALCDIAEIVLAYPEMDWERVIAHGACHGWSRGVAAALCLACEHLGAAVPARVLDALGANVLDPDMLVEAMEHLVECVELPDELRTAPNLVAVADERSLTAKLAAVAGRVFVPKAELALIYGVPGDSPRLMFYYAIRLRDLLHRYAASAWSLSVSDPRLAAAAASHARLGRWIREG